MDSKKFVIYDTIEKDWKSYMDRFIIESSLISYDSFSIELFHNWYDHLRTTEKCLSFGTKCFMQYTRLSIRSTQSNPINIVGYGKTKKCRLYHIIQQIYDRDLYLKVKFQMMDGDPPDGKPIEASEKQTTTILEVAADEETATSGAKTVMPTLDELCNTEMDFEMPQLTNRFEVFRTETINVDENKYIGINLPQELFSNTNQRSANLQLFRGFVYSKLEIEIRVIVNAPKFGQGKLILSWFPDQADDINLYYEDRCSLVQRPHVMMDLNVQTEATLIIPQAYRRTFIRNLRAPASALGLNYAKMAMLQIATLSPYKTGPGQPQSIPIQIMYRFVKAKFAGITYPIDLQMDKMIDLASMYPPIAAAENVLKRTGFIGNQDKPYDQTKHVFVPTPRRDFCSGIGLSDAIPLTFAGNSTVTTLDDYINEGDPVTIYDITRKWGLLGEFEWKVADAKETQLVEYFVTPCPRIINERVGVTYAAMNIHPTPLDMISGSFAFYRGTIDYKLCFVSTPFHTGTIQIEISYGRVANTVWETASVYTKTFQLGEDREVEFTVPYIYDTPWRRCSSIVQLPSNSWPGGEFKVGSYGVYYDGSNVLQLATSMPLSSRNVIHTKFRVRVLNPLTPLMNVASTINVLVFQRGGSDYQLHSVVPNTCVNLAAMGGDQRKYPPYMQQLIAYKRGKYHVEHIENDDKFDIPNVGASLHTASANPIYVNENIRNNTRLYLQSDFDTGPNLKYFHSTDNEELIKTLMRRNYYLKRIRIRPLNLNKVEVHEIRVNNVGFPVKVDGFNVYMLPVYIPNHLTFCSNFMGPLAAPISVLMTLFRHWRGSLRYTFIADSAKAPIYFSYVPNLGTSYIENKLLPKNLVQIGDQIDSNEHVITLVNHPGGLGFATEMMLPSVNNSISITTPFDCMFNRCVNAARVRLTDHSNVARLQMRDDVTMHAGHLMIYSTEDVAMDAWISAGDDFQMMNFVGNSRYRQNLVTTIEDDQTRESNGNFQYNQVREETKPVKTDVETKPSPTGPTIYERIKAAQDLLSAPIDYQMFGGAKRKIKKTLTSIDENAVEAATNVDAIRNDINSFLATTSEAVASTSAGIQNTVDTANATMVCLTNTVVETSNDLKDLTGSTREILNKTEQNIDAMTTNVSTAATTIAESSERVTTDFNEHMSKISGNFKKLTDGMGDGMDKIMNAIRPVIDKLTGFCEQFGKFKTSIVSYTIDVIFDIIILARNFSIETFCLIFLRYVAKILSANITDIISYSTKMLTCMKRMLGFGTKQQMSDPTPGETGCGLSGFFVSLIASIFRVKCESPREKFNYGSQIKDYIFDPRSPQYMNGVMSLFDRTFKIFMHAIKYVKNKSIMSRETVLEKMSKNSDEIAQFMADVNDVTNPANQKILQRSDMVLKAWKSYMYARAMKTKLVLCPGNGAASILLREVERIIKFCDENWARMSCCPVRLEPLVVCFSGGSNIGKSHMSLSFGLDMMSAVGYKHEGSNPTYTRAPGRKHWDGYYDQPIILFDDWMNLSDPQQVTEQIADLYELKSTCDFIPAKASISEKGAKANPWLVMLLTNNAFPDSSMISVCNHKNAVYRRRDLLWCVKMAPGFTNANLHSMEWEYGQSYPHLLFKSTPSVMDPGTTLENIMNDPNGWIGYDEMKRQSIDRFTKYMDEEKAMAKHRLDQFCRDLPESIRNLANPMEVFNFRRAASSGTPLIENIPSHQLDAEITEMMSQLNPVIRPQIEFMRRKPRPDGLANAQQLLEEMNGCIGNHTSAVMEKYWHFFFDVRNTDAPRSQWKREWKHHTLSCGHYDGECKRACVALAWEKFDKWCGGPDLYKVPHDHKKCALITERPDQNDIDVLLKDFDVDRVLKAHPNILGIPFDDEKKKRQAYEIFIIEAKLRLKRYTYHMNKSTSYRLTRTVDDVEYNYGQYIRFYSQGYWGQPDEHKCFPYDYGLCTWQYHQYKFQSMEDVKKREFAPHVYCTCTVHAKNRCSIEYNVDTDQLICQCENCPMEECSYRKFSRRFGINGEEEVCIECMEKIAQDGDRIIERYLYYPDVALAYSEESEPEFEHKSNAVSGVTVSPDGERRFILPQYVDDPIIDMIPQIRQIERLSYRNAHSAERDIILDAFRGRDDIIHAEYAERRRQLSGRVLAALEQNQSGQSMEHLNNVRLCDPIFGGQLVSIPQEMLSAGMNPHLRSDWLKCHHCLQSCLIQWGTAAHHVCSQCREVKSKCDYCCFSDNVKPKKLFKKPIYAFIGRCASSTWEGTKTFLRQWMTFSGLYTSVMVLFAGYLIGMCYYVYSVIRGPSYQACEINDDDFTAGFDAMILLRAPSTVCKHDLLLSHTEPDYLNCEWSIVCETGQPIVMSAFPCERNCWILASNANLRQYRAYCHNYYQIRKSRCNDAMNAANADPLRREETLSGIPPFCRPRILLFEASYDIFEYKRLGKYRSMLKRTFDNAMMLINVNPTSSKMKILLASVGAIISAIAAIRGLFSFAKYIYGKFVHTEEQYDYDKTRHFVARRAAGVRAKTGFKSAGGGISQQNCEEFYTVVHRKLAKNSIIVEIYSNGERTAYMCMMGIFNRNCIMPKHYYERLVEASKVGDAIYIRQPYYPSIKIDYKFDASDFLISSTADIAIFVMPKYVNTFSDIRGYLATERDFSGLISSTGFLHQIPTSVGQDAYTIRDIKISGVKKNVMLNNGECMPYVLKYNYGKEGTCGSIVLRPKHTRPILAMHIAGTESNVMFPAGYGVLLAAETFNEFDEPVLDSTIDSKPDEAFNARMQFENMVQLQAVTAIDQSPYMGIKTKIRPSHIHDYDGEKPKTKPCYLSSRNDGYQYEKGPLLAGCEKHGKLTKNFTTSEMREVTDVLWNAKYLTMRPVVAEPRRLTMLEAIRGFTQDGYEPMNLDTSMGYPYALTPKKVKREYIEIKNPTDDIEKRIVFMNSDVINHVNKIIADRQMGLISDLPYIDWLKDERRAIDKVESYASTRIFCMSPIANTINGRMNFLHFSAAYKAHRFRNQHAVGISRDGPDWTTLVKLLLENSDKIVSLDYSNFGPGYNAGICACAHEIVKRWTMKYVSGVNEIEIDVLGEEHFNSLHLMNNLIYRQLSGGPSGDSMTVEKNGLVNELYILLAWRALAMKNLTSDTSIYDKYFSNVVVFTYGDDVIMSISDDVIDWFNAITITKFFSQYGIVATDADKTAELKPYHSLHETTFLKSGFLEHPKWKGEWLAPLDWTSVTETPRWIYQCEDHALATRVNAEAGLRNSFGHGPERFNELKQKINDALVERDIEPLLLTWDELDRDFFSKYYKK